MIMESSIIQVEGYDVNLRRILGSGAFGIVYTGKNRTTSHMIAVKNITYKKTGEKVNKYLKKMGKNELEIFQKLKDNDNILKIFNHHDDGEAIWIFMEYCNLRDLPFYLKTTMELPLSQKLKIMHECISAIDYMHSFTPQIIHRDIKPQNVLMTNTNDEHVVKITDFGIGKLLESSSGSLLTTMTTLAGTASYMAPEFSTRGHLKYKAGIDVFSLGLLFHVILQYDKSNSNLTPMSTKVTKTKKMCNFGQEMSHAVQNNLPLPKLFEPPPAESDSPLHEVQRIITDMIKYHESERPKTSVVKDKVYSLYEEILAVLMIPRVAQTKGSKREQKCSTIRRCSDIDGDTNQTIEDLKENNGRLQEELSLKEHSFQDMLEEKDAVIRKLEVEVAQQRNVIDMLLNQQQQQQEGPTKTPVEKPTGDKGQPKKKTEHRMEATGNPFLEDLQVEKDVELIKLMNKEAFGEIWQANVTVHGKNVKRMLKIINEDMYKRNFRKTAGSIRKLKHDKIMPIMGVCTYFEAIYVITELMTNGCLINYLRADAGKTIKLNAITAIASQIAEGMDYLADNHCIHRDLRASNIFLGETIETVRIGNFFSAVFINDKSEVYYEKDSIFKFPKKWTAPEVVLERKYSFKSDVWSYGILLYELFTYGRIPYPGMTGSEVVKRLTQGYRMPRSSVDGLECPQSIYEEVILKCWDASPENRPSFTFCNYFFKDNVCREPTYMNQNLFVQR